MTIKQISVLVENKTGAIAEAISFLAGHGINIVAVNMADTPNFGILRFIVDQPEKCRELLEKEGFTVSACRVLAVGLEDIPGGLTKVTKILAQNGISLEYLYAFISKSKENACVIINTADIEFTAEILTKNGILLYGKEIFGE
ncbi:MAG TPA: hypothetical protein PKD52_03320 [Clostridiales bacterium]|nr:hypothetical protein [Clostridiales bacterium]